MKYRTIYYTGNVVKDVVPGEVLGTDQSNEPYEIVDAEYDPATNRTTVQLMTASKTGRKLRLKEIRTLEAQYVQLARLFKKGALSA